jgi:hypothetical protein
MATVADMDITSTPAAETTEGMVTAVDTGTDTGTDTAGEDTTAVVITGTIAGTGVAVVIMEAPTGAVRYSASDSAMFDQGRFAMTRTGIRCPATCRHTVRTHTESRLLTEAAEGVRGVSDGWLFPVKERRARSAEQKPDTAGN